jgi:pimeloyl-ACP methyl ester carboxylesterase
MAQTLHNFPRQPIDSPPITFAEPNPTAGTLELRSIRSFFLGGRTVRLSGLPVEQRRTVMGGVPRTVDPNGDYSVGQMYVQEYRLAAPRHALPILLWHGGGMTGSHWESTADGHVGWLWLLLRAGYDVLVCDAVERGRASWARFPEIYAGPPLFRTREEAWHMFRIGPVGGYTTDPLLRRAFAGQQFPVEAFDAFSQQWVARWPDHETLTLEAYDALLAWVGRAIVIGHSQGGGFAMAAAQRCPQHVAAVVAIEPGGAPAAPTGALAPHLIVWGDHFEPPSPLCPHPVWSSYRAMADAYCAAAARYAGPTNPFDVFDLPGLGIRGNSHFPMNDRNAPEVAALIVDWLARCAA